MAYDEKLADRIRQAVGPRADVTEKKMFGGLAFLLDGKMFCGIEGYVYVGPGGSRTVKAIAKWVERGAAFVTTLPRRPRARRR